MSPAFDQMIATALQKRNGGLTLAISSSLCDSHMETLATSQEKNKYGALRELVESFESSLACAFNAAHRSHSRLNAHRLELEHHKTAKLSEVNQEELVDALFDERMHIPPIPSLSPAKRCLLVLDLNGTLLHRRRTNSGANTYVYARPYLGAFLRYISHPAAALDVAVWSSAKRVNVELMVDRAWTGAGTGRGLGGARLPDLVFAREDMLLTERQFRRAYRHGTFNPDHNVRTTKDLRQLWLKLAHLRDERIRVHERQQTAAGPSTPAVRSPEALDYALHGPHDTILLDDSAHKARLQPQNHLSLPSYGAAELRADANSLSSLNNSSGGPHVDEALLAVVGILSEVRHGAVDHWNRSGRIWRGPGARLDPYEMWAQRQVEAGSTSSQSHEPSLARRLRSLPRSESPSIAPYEADLPFAPNAEPTPAAELPQWFTSPPLFRAWIEHGRQVLTGLGIQAEHGCVRTWPGWREGETQIRGHAKDDRAVRSSGSTHKTKKGDSAKSRRQESTPKGTR